MKLTEKLLLDGYHGLTHGMDYVSVIEGNRIIWAYRCLVNGKPECVTTADNAEIITLEYDRCGTIELCFKNKNHPAKIKMQDDENKFCGTSM